MDGLSGLYKSLDGTGQPFKRCLFVCIVLCYLAEGFLYTLLFPFLTIGAPISHGALLFSCSFIFSLSYM